MSIMFSCASCRAKLRSKPELAGKRVKCPKCGHTQLPSPAGNKPEPAKESALEQLLNRIAATEEKLADKRLDEKAGDYYVLDVISNTSATLFGIQKEVQSKKGYFPWETVRWRLKELAARDMVKITSTLGADPEFESEWGLTDAGRRHLQEIADLKNTLATLQTQKAELEMAQSK